MKEYVEGRIKRYEVALEKIQQAIEECGNNDLWNIIENLEKGKFELIDLIEEDEKMLSKYD